MKEALKNETKEQSQLQLQSKDVTSESKDYNVFDELEVIESSEVEVGNRFFMFRFSVGN